MRADWLGWCNLDRIFDRNRLASGSVTTRRRKLKSRGISSTFWTARTPTRAESIPAHRRPGPDSMDATSSPSGPPPGDPSPFGPPSELLPHPATTPQNHPKSRGSGFLSSLASGAGDSGARCSKGAGARRPDLIELRPQRPDSETAHLHSLTSETLLEECWRQRRGSAVHRSPALPTRTGSRPRGPARDRPVGRWARALPPRTNLQPHVSRPVSPQKRQPPRLSEGPATPPLTPLSRGRVSQAKLRHAGSYAGRRRCRQLCGQLRRHAAMQAAMPAALHASRSASCQQRPRPHAEAGRPDRIIAGGGRDSLAGERLAGV